MDPVLKNINTDKKLWQLVTEYPPNLQWAVCNFHRASRGVFSSRSIGATLSQQMQSVSGLPISILLAFFTPVLRWMRLFSGSPTHQSPPVLLSSVLHISSLSLFYYFFIFSDHKAVPVKISVSFNFHPGVIGTPVQKTDTLSFLVQASSIVPRGAWWAIQGLEGNRFFASELSF